MSHERRIATCISKELALVNLALLHTAISSGMVVVSPTKPLTASWFQRVCPATVGSIPAKRPAKKKKKRS